MKMNVRKSIFTLVAVVTILSMLAACTPAPAAAPQAAQPTTAPTQPVKISLWGGFPEMEPFYKYAAAEYTKTHPNVTFEITTQPLREFEQKLSATIPADTSADLIEISMYANQKFIAAGLIPEVPAKVKEFMSAPNRYSEFAIKNNTYNGKLYGLPLFQGVTALYYNKAMFAEAGIKEPPKTMDEMKEMAKKLAKFDASGTLTRSGHSLRLSGQGSGVAEKFWFVLWPMGGSILEEKNGKYRAGYDNDAGRAALKYYIDSLYADKSDNHKIKHDAEAFELGQTAMFLRESWVIGDIAAKAPTLEYDTAPVPQGARWGHITNPVNLYVTKSCKNPDVAWDFANFLVQQEQQIWMLDNVGWLPVRQDVDMSSVIAKKPQFKAFLTKDANYKEYGYVGITVFDEIMTKFAERLVNAYLDTSLLNNPAGITKVMHDAAVETNDILKKADLYSGD